MRILYLTTHLRGTDGWSRYSLTLASEMKKRGHKVFALVERLENSESIQQTAVLSVHYRYILNPIFCWRGAKKIQKTINDFKPDIVHIVVEPYANMLPFLRLNQNVKVIMTIHGTYSYAANLFVNPVKKYLARTLFLTALRFVKSIISVSTFTRDYFLQNIFGNKTPYLEVIPNGVEIKSFARAVSDDKESESPRILFVGGVKRRKGLVELINGLEFYNKHLSDNFSCTIVGSYDEKDWYYKEICDRIADASLSGKVQLTGRISEDSLEKAYAESNLFILLPVNDAGRFEGFGLVYIEANARGIPVIGAKNSGAVDAIQDGKSGLLVDPKNPADIAKAIDEIIRGKKIRPEDCRAWAVLHSIDKTVDRVLSVYNS